MRRRLALLAVALAGFLLVGATITRVTSIQTLTVASGLTLSGGQLLLPNGAASAPALAPESDTDTGLVFRSGAIDFYTAATARAALGSNLTVQSSAQLGWSSGNPTLAVHDISLSRAAAGVLGVRTSTQADNAGDIGTATAGRPRDVNIARNLHVAGYFHLQSALTYGAHVVTIAADGGVGTNTEILAGDRSLYLVSCNDANGCVIRMGETAPSPGTMTQIINIDVNTLTWADIAGVQHTAASFSMGVADAVTATYVRNRSGDQFWVETGRSDN